VHKLTSAFILGYHGCDRRVAEDLLSGVPFAPSANDYDWLGEGVYFWEANPLRGIEFAREKGARDGSVREPYVVGAVIDLGFCLDLLSSTGTAAVASAYEDLRAHFEAAGKTMPSNTRGPDSLLRALDCAVVNHLHAVRERAELQAFDSVRGVFFEGGPSYPGSGFSKKAHIQICVRALSCIKGVFRVPNDQLNP
jgi:hypothetical protein